MSFIVDILATCSIVGIWPRFIEPRLVKTTELTWKLQPGSAHLEGFKIVQLSDLHFHSGVPQKFLDKVARIVSGVKPDLILFTGDFLCYAQLEDAQRLRAFLETLSAPHGTYCIFGNHDYARYVSRDEKGVYDSLAPSNPVAGILKGLRAMFSSGPLDYAVSKRVLSIPLHESLCGLLEHTPFKILDNTTVTLPVGLNLTGLGDLALGRCQPQKAFGGYNPDYPGIILSHNPDSFPLLLDFPGEWILSGHTHGEQIHLPWPKWGRKLSSKLTRLDNPGYTRGLYSVGNKQLYVNRGLGCHKPFRFCSPPEVTLIKASVGT